MATAELLPIEEYLETDYRPDCHYVDGALQSRNAGEMPHSAMLGIFALKLGNSRKRWNIWPSMIERIRVSETRVRVADICAYRRGVPLVSSAQVPPLLCIEVLSPQDELSQLQGLVDDFLHLGVENIWIVDPELRRAWTAHAAGLRPVSEKLCIEGTKIVVLLADVWAELDEFATMREPKAKGA